MNPCGHEGCQPYRCSSLLERLAPGRARGTPAPMPERLPPTDADDLILRLAAQGHGVRRIVTETGLTNYAVRKAMKRLGVGGKAGRRAVGVPCPACGGTGRVQP